MLAEQTRTVPVRPLPAQSSKTIISADMRTRQLAQAMALQLRSIMRGLYMTDDVIARIWPKLCVKLAAHVARLPLPGAA